MSQTKVKSANTAGLLGIFLGIAGAHSWYLGERNKGIIHVCIGGGGLLLVVIGVIISTFIAPKTAGDTLSLAIGLTKAPTIGAGLILTILGALAMGGSAIWGLVEGILIMTKGDAGLAAQGFAIATIEAPETPENNNN